MKTKSERLIKTLFIEEAEELPSVYHEAVVSSDCEKCIFATKEEMH